MWVELEHFLEYLANSFVSVGKLFFEIDPFLITQHLFYILDSFFIGDETYVIFRLFAQYIEYGLKLVIFTDQLCIFTLF